MPPHRALRSKAQLVRSTLLAWIESGRLQPGQQMPSEKELAARIGVNHQTVRRGLQALVDEGLVVKEPRVGNFVSQTLPWQQPTAQGIGLILPRHMFSIYSNAAATAFFEGVSQAFDPQQFQVQTLIYDKYRLWDQAGQPAVARGLKGVILRADQQTSPEDVKRIIDAGVKVVLVEAWPCFRQLGAPWVNEEEVESARQITQRLLNMGHRRLLVVHYARPGLRHESMEAIADLCRSHGLHGQPASLLLDNWETLDMERLACDLAVRYQQVQPTAIVVPDETIGNAVMSFLYENHLRVPVDVSVCALRNYAPLLSLVPLASPDSVQVRQQMVQLAADKLKQLINGQPIIDQGTQVTPSICWRRSIAKAPDCEPGGTQAATSSASLPRP